MAKASAQKVLKTVKKKPTPHAKMKAKPKIKVKSKPKSPPPPSSQAREERGFMWKILKQKQADQKKAEQNPANPFKPASEFNPRNPSAQIGFGRFAGPRRRAG